MVQMVIEFPEEQKEIENGCYKKIIGETEYTFWVKNGEIVKITWK